jgi:hypothetical protein
LHRCVKFHDTEYAVYGVSATGSFADETGAAAGVNAAETLVSPAECAVDGTPGAAPDPGDAESVTIRDLLRSYADVEVGIYGGAGVGAVRGLPGSV